MKTLEQLKSEYKQIDKEYLTLKELKHPKNNPSFDLVEKYYDACATLGAKMREMQKIDNTITQVKALS